MNQQNVDVVLGTVRKAFVAPVSESPGRINFGCIEGPFEEAFEFNQLWKTTQKQLKNNLQLELSLMQ